MTAWAKIREIFEELVELEAAERAARLDALGPGDAEIRSRVQRLLDEDAADDVAEIEAAPAVDLVALDPSRLRRIGNYDIVRVLGAGGMGTVFEARQERPRRTVALKVLRTMVGSEVARRRLEYEAETLARLRHPNVAQIYESGTWRDPDTGEESPFFAMEFVDGARPLDRYADVEQLDLNARLRLFLDVCDAVQHGHQNGVLHRDLKPANLLVGADGRAKVIDFGIARATGAVDDAATLHTLTGQVLGTLGYMSPEQLDAETDRIDARSDVYSLGATLYQLLVGRTPHEKGTDSLSKFAARVRDELPPRPSSVAVKRFSVSAEIDWIVLRALAPEPDERYASVSELAADVRRFLGDEPVTARPLTTGYLLRKFVRRHRLQVVAAVAILVAMVAGTVATAIGWSRAVEAERTAELRRQEAVEAERTAEVRRQEAEQLAEELWEVTRLQTGILRGARGDRTVKLVDLLERARTRLGDGEMLPHTVAAGLHKALAIAFEAVSLNDRALEQFEKASARASRFGGRSRRQALAIEMDYAEFLTALGRLDEAEPMLRDTWRGQLELYPEDHWRPALTRCNLANLLAERGDHAAAVEHYTAGLPALEGGLREDYSAVLAARLGLATSLHEVGRTEDAAKLFEEIRPALVEAVGAEDPETLSATNTHAAFLLEIGEIDRALALLREVLPAQIKVRGPEHPSTLRVYSNIALCHERREQYPEAETIYREILATRGDSGRNEPIDLITRFNLGVALHRQENASKLAEAVDLLERLVRDAAKIYPADNWRVAVFRHHLGIALRKSGRFDDAEAALVAAREVLEAKLGPTHQRTLSNYRAMADLYDDRGEHDEAERWRARAEGN